MEGWIWKLKRLLTFSIAASTDEPPIPSQSTTFQSCFCLFNLQVEKSKMTTKKKKHWKNQKPSFKNWSKPTLLFGSKIRGLHLCHHTFLSLIFEFVVVVNRPNLNQNELVQWKISIDFLREQWFWILYWSLL